MATTNSTPNYQLPIYAPNDVTSWLVEWNTAMTQLDTDIANVQEMASTAGADVELVEKAVQKLNASMESLSKIVGGNTNDIDTNKQEISNLKESTGQLTKDVVALGLKVDNAVEKVGTVYSGVIGVGEDTLTVKVDNLTSESLIDIYSDEYGLVPTNVTANVTEKLVTVKVATRETTLQVRVMVR